jgi:hypothetical protein
LRRIGIDLDGCLADFNTGYLGLLEEVSGLRCDVGDPTIWPSQWDWPQLLGPLGITQAHEDLAWQQIMAGTRGFWTKLRPYVGVDVVGERCNALSVGGHDLYFITSRPGRRAKAQSEYWLREIAGVARPTVLISHKKGLCAAGLELQHMIDDKPENLQDVRKMMGLSCQGWLVDRPWNRQADRRFMHVVGSVGEALDEIMKEPVA